MMKRSLSATLLLLVLTLGVHAEDKPAAPTYPLTTCVVSGENLGAMGKPVDYIYKEEGKPDRLVKFCCRMCLPKFKKDPAKYLSKLDAAEAGKATPGTTASDPHAAHSH